ncbi:hypothetical protein [Jatrophihabitans fulvus]
MDDPWGLDQPPAVAHVSSLPGRDAGDDAPDLDPYDRPSVGDLPEVSALTADGWTLLHPAPLYELVPAAWPAELRTWVPVTQDSWAADDARSAARAAGLPAPPPHRLWLLRSPFPRLPVTAVHEIVWAEVERRRGDDWFRTREARRPHTEQVQVFEATRELTRWDEDRFLAACPDELRQLLDAWAAEGHTGEPVARLVGRRIRPDQLRRAQDRTGLDAAALLDWLDSTEGDPEDDDLLDFVTAWREAGLPGDPPPGAERFREFDLSELRAWLDAGYPLHHADRLREVGLERAIAWRAAGFGPGETKSLFAADPTLTVAEARAFDGVDLRDEWVRLGFSGDEARAWAAEGLGPSEARLWRAVGRRPSEVDGHTFPPELLGSGVSYVGFSSVNGINTYDQWDELPDPPGTRGRRANRD